MSYRVWYCDNPRCRKVLHTDPKGVLPRGCRCKTPKLPKAAAVIHDYSNRLVKQVGRLRTKPNTDSRNGP